MLQQRLCCVAIFRRSIASTSGCHQSGGARPIPFNANVTKQPTDTKPTESTVAPRVQRINRAMQAYIDASEKRRQFISVENAEFENGKRHLANMMGLDAATMTQEDIDNSIKYLFPSSLFEKKARPVMQPPEVLFPPKLSEQFDKTGRPFDPLFYTLQPQYYKMMRDLAVYVNKCNAYEAQQPLGAVTEKMQLHNSRWKNKKELSEYLRTNISDEMYSNFVAAADYLVQHKYSNEIMSLRVILGSETLTKLDSEIAFYTSEVMTCEETGMRTTLSSWHNLGRAYVRAESKRKMTRVIAYLYSQGTGKFVIDGETLDKLGTYKSREECVSPLVVVDRLRSYDVRIHRDCGEGESALSGAIRLAVARALTRFVSAADKEALRLAGYLTYDPRVRERHKINQPGPRKKATWKAR